MSGFQTPQIGGQGGYAGGGGLLGFLTQALSGYENAHKMKLEEKQSKEEGREKKAESAENIKGKEADIQHESLENNVLQAGLAEKAQATAQANAQTTWDNITKTLQNNPEIAKDPSIMNGLVEAGNVLHKPIVKNKDGTLNVDALMPQQFSDLTPDQKAYYQGLDPKIRKSQMKGIGDVPSDFMNSKASATYKEQTERLKAQSQVTRANTGAKAESHREYVDDEKLPVWERLEKARTALVTDTDSTSKQKAYATINHLNAESAKAGAEAAAIPARLALTEEGLNLRAQSVSTAMQRLQYDTDPTSIKNLEGSTRDLDTYADRTESELGSAEKALSSYAASKPHGVVPPDDQLGQQLQSRIHRLNDQLYEAKRQADKARGALVGHQFQGRAITQQSGKQSTILPRKSPSSTQPVGDAPPGTQDGKTGTYHGKKVVVRDGKLYPRQ